MSLPSVSLVDAGRDHARGGRYTLGDFEIDLDAEQLTREGVAIPLAPQPFRLLRYLLLTEGRLVTREELKQELWGDETFVDFDRGLNFCVLQIRTPLGDDAKQPLYIETVPRKGYRFIADVMPLRDAALLPGRRSPLIRPWIGVAAISLCLVVAGAIWKRSARPSSPASSKRVLVAVLPLDNLSVPADANLVDGLTEEVITELGKLDPRRLGVMARTSVEQFRGSRKDVRTIARALGVDYIVEGSVRREGSTVRAAFQLIRASDQTHLWAESVDRDSSDLLQLQRDVARGVARSLELRLAPAVTTLRSDPRAFDAYLRGRALGSRRSSADIEESVRYFERSIALQPDFAAAHVALAESWHLLQMRGRIAPAEARRKIEESLARALATDPGLAQAQAALGTLRFWYEWNFEGAEESFRNALALNPSNAAALHDHGWLLIARGRADAGIRELQSAQEIDPLSPRSNIDVAWAYIYTHRYDQAILEARRALGLDPEFEEAHRCLQHAYELKGDFRAALEEARGRFVALGRLDEWRTIEHLPPEEALRRIHQLRYEELLRLRSERFVDPYRLAAEQAHLGRIEESLRWLQEALQIRSTSLPLAGADPMLIPLRSDPRFSEILHGTGIR